MNCKITENSEGTASNKHTKQQKRNTKNKKIKNQKFSIKCKITKITRELPHTNIPNNKFLIWKAKPKEL